MICSIGKANGGCLSTPGSFIGTTVLWERFELDNRKGVNVIIWKDEDMPTDKFGNRADICAAPGATITRSNPGGSHEQFIGAAGRDVIKRVRRALHLPDMAVLEWDKVWSEINKQPEKLCKEQYEYILGFYNIVARTTNYKASKRLYDEGGKWMEDLCHIILDGNDPKGMYITNPSNSKRRMAQVIRTLRNDPKYCPEVSTVTYRASSGLMVESKDNVLIGPNYFLSLEKTATDGSATSITRLGHHGTPTRLTNADKHLRPSRETGTKTNGEAENRNLAKSVGSQPLADISDMYNDPHLLRIIARTHLTHETPTNIPEIIPRDYYVEGGHRPLSYTAHMHMCSGKVLSRD